MKKPLYPVLALVSALFLQPITAQADGADDEDDLALAYGDKATVSIATGSQQALRRAPAVATVITAEDIAAMGATDLDEVMETVPGLHVSRSANSYAPIYAIRGIYSQFAPQALVLQNGIPVTTLYLGNKGNIWGGFPLEHIARIEVIRGPGSALYGADAYSGVINNITKNAADVQGTEFGLRGGSFNNRSTWVQHGGKLGPVDVAAYLRVGGTDGFKETVPADAQTRLDQLLHTNASLAPGAVNTGYDAADANVDLSLDRWRLRGGYKWRDNTGAGAGVAQALDPVGRGRSERITADLSWLEPQLTPNWGLGFNASYQHYVQAIPHGLQLFPPGANLGAGAAPQGLIGSPETWERQVRLSTFATYSGWEGHNLRLGLGHDDLDLYKTHELRNFTYSPTGVLVPVAGGALVDFTETDPFLRPHRRTIDYAYAQDEWSLAKDWTLTAGLRHDVYSDFGGTTNPRLALVWDASLDLTAKLLVGRAFRAPSFLEVYGASNPVALGNLNLRPETIGTVEMAFAWQVRPDLLANLSLFRYDMKDIIRTVGGVYANTGAQNGRGAELETVWDVDRNVRLSGNYSWQQSIDEATQQDAGYVPHQHVYLRLDWRLSGGWLASSQVNWVGDRKRAPGDLRTDVADYNTVDLSLRTRVGGGRWDLSTSVRNLFNSDVREPSIAPGTALPNDLPMAGRSVYLQAVYRL